MKLEDFLIIKDEIEEELANIDKLYNYYTEVTAKNLDKESKKRIISSIIADFYMGVERIFKIIAREIDSNLPQGSGWHKKLLRQMSVSIPGKRMEVIDKSLFHLLEDYLKFRHLVRNIYGFQIKPDKYEDLLKNFQKIKGQLHRQLIDFLEEMEKIILEAEK